jgi:hypothetical protein
VPAIFQKGMGLMALTGRRPAEIFFSAPSASPRKNSPSQEPDRWLLNEHKREVTIGFLGPKNGRLKAMPARLRGNPALSHSTSRELHAEASLST